MNNEHKFWKARKLLLQKQVSEAYLLFNQYVQSTLTEYEQIRYWDGRDPKGCSLYIFDTWLLIDSRFGNHQEKMGLGDHLQYSRYFSYLEELDAQVIVECHPTLHKLFSHNYPAVDFSHSKPAHYDYLFFGGALPSIFGLAPSHSYLKPFQKICLPKTNLPRIGICWSASVKERSIPLKVLEPILEISDCEFWAVQKGHALVELEQYSSLINFIDLQDFAHTSALVAELDLIISVDTSVAHLAGAMGKAVWVLLFENADSRWGNASNTEWYSTMQIFRCFRKGNEAIFIGQVALSLRHWLRKFLSK